METEEERLAGYGNGPGWNTILTRLETRLAAVPADVTIDWAEEKYGTLRVTWHTDPDVPLDDAILREIDAAVYEAESASAVTCETCGAPGTTRQFQGWYMTRCDEHFADEVARMGRQGL